MEDSKEILKSLSHVQLRAIYIDFIALLKRDVLVTPNKVLKRLLEAQGHSDRPINQVISLQADFNEEFISRFMYLKFINLDDRYAKKFKCKDVLNCNELINPQTECCTKCGLSFKK